MVHRHCHMGGSAIMLFIELNAKMIFFLLDYIVTITCSNEFLLDSQTTNNLKH